MLRIPPRRTISRLDSSSPEAVVSTKSSRTRLSRAKSIKISAKQFVTHKKDLDLHDEYIVGELLGSGGYGEVYSAVHKRTGAERAVKVVAKQNNSHDNTIRNEFQILKTLDHPNCLKQFHLFEDAHNFHIVTDYYAGGELFDALQEELRMSEEDTATLLNHILSCVNYFHSCGVVHRDLKPENILLDANHNLEDCKIIDFGLSAFYDEKKDEPLTEVVGTSYYGSPQVFDGQPYTAKCDVWSCGVLAFLLLSGYAPFDGNTNKEIIHSVVEGVVQFDDPVWDHISDTAKDFIIYLLSYEENTRPTALQALQHPWLSQQRRDSCFSFKTTSRKSLFATAALENMEKFDAQSKLKQATYALLSSQLLSPTEKDEIDKVFRIVDADCSGKLSRDELKVAFRDFYHKNLTDEEIDVLFKKVNFSGSGTIEYSEFVVACMMENSILDERKLRAAFAEFDLDGSGSISIDELKEVFYSGCNEETVDQAMVDAIIQSVDKDGDNEIDFEEFRCMMLLTATASQPSKTTLNGSTGFQEKEQAAKKTTYKSSPSSLSSFTTSTGDISDSSFSSTSDEDGLHHRNTSATHRNSKKDELEALASMMKGKTKARRSMFERCTTENN